MTETNRLLSQIKGELQKQPETKSSSELESGIETLTNETIGQMEETLNQTPEEAGAKFIEHSDVQYIQSAFGSIPAASCENPVLFKTYSLEICHRASTINSFLYWIVAVLTVLFVYSELNLAFRTIN